MKKQHGKHDRDSATTAQDEVPPPTREEKYKLRMRPDFEFAYLIRQLRRDKNLTQSQVAFKAQVSTPYIWQMENARAYPSKAVVKRLASLFGLNKKILLAKIPEKQKQKKRWESASWESHTPEPDTATYRQQKAWKPARKEFNRILKSWRKEAGLNQHKFATMFFGNHIYYNAIEKGRAPMPGFKTIVRIARELKKDPTRLLILKALSLIPPIHRRVQEIREKVLSIYFEHKPEFLEANKKLGE